MRLRYDRPAVEPEPRHAPGAMDDRDLRRVCKAELDRDCACRAPRAQDHRAQSSDPVDAGQRLQEALPSVLSPTSSPCRLMTQFTAPIILAAGFRRSSNGTTATLWGIVQLNPFQFMARAPFTASPRASGLQIGWVASRAFSYHRSMRNGRKPTASAATQ